MHHLHGHLAAVWLTEPDVGFPIVTLVASGGHTALVRVDAPDRFRVLGQTLDDAAGEAMDKGARLLGLGYPGGRELDQLAECGDARAFAFPVALRDAGRLDFSFSGVKTALFYAAARHDRRRAGAPAPPTWPPPTAPRSWSRW